MSNDFFPTASLETLRWRSAVLRRIREFFDSRGFFEAETPLLSHDGPVDPHLDAFTIDVGRETFALQTSPEFGLKRLVAAGAERVFQLGKSFRRGERGRLHNPEFTMLEWYQAGDTYREQMQFVEDLIRHASGGSGDGPAIREGAAPVELGRETARQEPRPPGGFSRFHRMTYREAFLQYAGIDPLQATVSELKRLAETRCLAIPDLSEHDRDGWLNLLLAELVEPNLGRTGPEFLCDYPATQSALSFVRHDDPPVSERFELYVLGIEICNGYTELTDPDELESRIARESARRKEAGLPPLPEKNRLLAAMRHGLPPCAGVALGVDRLLMVLGGFETVDAVLTFPWERA